MARALRYSRARVRARTVSTTPIGTFVQTALGPVDWEQWWTFEDYRAYTNLQVFAGGMAAYAGKPPTILAASAGMDAVFQFVMANATWPPPQGAGPDPKAESAAGAAVEIALLMYEQDVVDNILPALVAKWVKQVGLFGAGIGMSGKPFAAAGG